MTNSDMSHSFTRLLALFAALLSLWSCSALEPKKIDYKSEAKQVRPLEIPPDLSSPSVNDRYAVPDSNTATASEYGQNQGVKPAGNSGMLPQSGTAHIERAGTQRWLVVNMPPEKAWPVVKDFWQEMGFIVVSENAETGIMETDWAENRAKIPQGWIRNAVGKVFDQAYSSPERDKFRSRFERSQTAGSTEIYVAHRGMYEMYVNDANMRQTGRTIWQPRATDPELEAEMLRLMQVKFNGGETAQTALGNAPPVVADPRAVVTTGASGTPVLMLKDDFDRAWRRVGLSLDRLGFSVQDRDRAGGLYYVRYLNPEENAKKPGLLSRLAFWEKDPAAKAEDYRILVAEAKTGAQVTGTQVQVQAKDGKPDNSDAATRILTVLQEDLR